jgi:hypothetical protein
VCAAIQQGRIKVFFEYRNSLADSRGCQILRARGTGDRAEVGDTDQAFKVANIDAES